MIGPSATRSPEQCLAAVANDRDRAAFSELFERFAPMLRGYLVRGGAPVAQADDLVQDIMLTVWHKAASYDPTRAAASTWIFAIARNRRIDALRRERRYEVEQGDAAMVPSSEPGPDSVVDREQQGVSIRAALADLPEEQGQIIRNAYYGDMTLARIAEDSAIPLGTVKSRVRLALQRLRSALAGERV